MALPDLLGLPNVPGLKPPVGKHWTWWVLWSVWTGFWLALLAVIIAVLLDFATRDQAGWSLTFSAAALPFQ